MTDMTTALVRRAWATALLALCVALGLGACGGSGSSTTARSSVPNQATASAGALPSGATASAAAASGATASATGPCQKARFAVHAGLAAGAFHRYLWKPYQSGTFGRGAPGRKAALVKGALAAAFTEHELRVAIQDIRGCPSAQALAADVQSGVNKVGALATSVKSGTVAPGAVTAVNGAVSSVESAARSQGIDVKEQEPTERQLAAGTAGQ